MRSLAFASLLLAVVSLLIAVASPVFAGGPVNLTGNWVGSYTCKVTTAEGKRTDKVDASLVITQLGPAGPLVVNIITEGPSLVRYSGTIVPELGSDDREGVGAWIACGTSDATTAGLFNEVETFSYKIDGDGSGSIKKSGVYVTNGTEVGVCKGSWTRVSTDSKTVDCSAP